MKQNKNVVLFLCMMCVFALTGCMKFVFNNGLSVDNPNAETNAYTNVEYNVYPLDGREDIYFGDGSHMRYDQLNSVQKVVYDEIFMGILNCDDSISISESINEDDLQKVYDAIINTADFELVYPTRKYDFKYDSITGEVYKITPKYDVTLEVRNTMLQEVDSVANQIVSKTYGMDDFQTVKYFHDYIVLNCSYSSDGDNYSNAYGTLIEGSAVCEGYARAFKYLCDKASIPCELVIGSTDMEHMWNIVKLDGSWYHIDLTWDDPKNKDGDYISYSYFNLTEEQILTDHTIDDTYTIPSSVSTRFNYFNYYGLLASSLDEFKDILYTSIYDACLNQEKYVYFKASDSTVYEEILSNLFDEDENGLYSIVCEASNMANVPLDTSAISISYDDDMLTFTITLSL